MRLTPGTSRRTPRLRAVGGALPALALVCSTWIVNPGRARADAPAAPTAPAPAPAPAATGTMGGETNNTVEVHDFATASGQDATMAKRSTSVTYLNPGVLLSFVGGRQHATGWGVEVSAMHYPTGTWQSFGYGPFLQAQLYDGSHPRVALGGQACLANFGGELGLAYRGGDDAYAGTASVHGAIFLSIAFVTLALRDTIALNGYNDGRSQKMGFGSEVAFSVSLKLPIMIQGRDPAGFSIFGGP
jgi:hypothetical protein